ncbi:hypothetical protein [Oryza sativa Japonica Group]|uniref:Uncharacterized protein n=2 Tax=Oryza sativa subsp. japonica TaxID=39947 RepID=Q5ZDF8_ORYSJ|nr:hypothetical protein [Oryza sativa Japonica Group]BAD61355.1 hypothetical protein [Oryza sativa Japonica Group]
MAEVSVVQPINVSCGGINLSRSHDITERSNGNGQRRDGSGDAGQGQGVRGGSVGGGALCVGCRLPREAAPCLHPGTDADPAHGLVEEFKAAAPPVSDELEFSWAQCRELHLQSCSFSHLALASSSSSELGGAVAPNSSTSPCAGSAPTPRAKTKSSFSGWVMPVWSPSQALQPPTPYPPCRRRCHRPPPPLDLPEMLWRLERGKGERWREGR